MLITFIAATVLGALGQSLAGLGGMIAGSIAGMVFGRWAARRLLPR